MHAYAHTPPDQCGACQDAAEYEDAAWDIPTRPCEGHSGPWSGARGPAAPDTYCVDTSHCAAPGMPSAYVIDVLEASEDAARLGSYRAVGLDPESWDDAAPSLPRYYSVQAVRSSGVQVPTFYLDSNVQGITSVIAAERVARDVIGDPDAYVFVMAAERAAWLSLPCFCEGPWRDIDPADRPESVLSREHVIGSAGCERLA
jgi:hypothetical protein